jgi:hypothetical protein
MWEACGKLVSGAKGPAERQRSQPLTVICRVTLKKESPILRKRWDFRPFMACSYSNYRSRSSRVDSFAVGPLAPEGGLSAAGFGADTSVCPYFYFSFPIGYFGLFTRLCFFGALLQRGQDARASGGLI